VEYAEPNYIVRKATIPNDPDFNMLWGLNNTGQTFGTVDADIDAPEAWDITTGSTNVIIAVIDTGVAYNHPDQNENIWVNTAEIAGNGIDDDGNGYIDDIYGWDFIDNDGYPEDYEGHGTHVSGTIAAKGNDGIGMVGVMWSAKIMPIRFLGVSGAGDIGNAVEAITYAVNNGARIINASWGSGGYSLTLYYAIDDAGSKDVLFVAAAGNEGKDSDSFPFYPASFNLPNIISVAATDDDDNLAYFSNYGATSVDLAAPGVDIHSSIPVFAYGTPIPVYGEENFDGASGNLPLLGWASGGNNSTWAITTGTGVDGTNSLEDSPGGDYLPDTDSWAGYMTPIESVKNNRYTLSFKWRGNIDPTTYDYLNINYSPDGAFWDWVDWTDGVNADFIPYTTYELTAAADFYDSFYFGFGLESDSTGDYDGVYIDNVVLMREPMSISGYRYESYGGTSMVAPHVSGVAGLILSANPSLTCSDVKNIILNNVDLKTSLSGKTLTGGRLNAFAAVSSLIPPAPLNLAATAISGSQIDLSWTDNSSNETGFKIERKTGSGGTYSEIATTGADVTSYSDTGLSVSTTYYYRVYAYNSVGNSPYSNEASVTTPEESKGGGGGACSIGMVHSCPTAVADTVVLLIPIVVIWILKRFRKFQIKK